VIGGFTRRGMGKGVAKHDLLDTTYLARLKITAQKHMQSGSRNKMR
jgi:hypothetical protein